MVMAVMEGNMAVAAEEEEQEAQEGLLAPVVPEPPLLGMLVMPHQLPVPTPHPAPAAPAATAASAVTRARDRGVPPHPRRIRMCILKNSLKLEEVAGKPHSENIFSGEMVCKMMLIISERYA